MDHREFSKEEQTGLPAFLGRAIVSMGAVLVLGVGLGLNIHKGASLLWTLGLFVTLALVLIILARWQVRPVTDPLEKLLREGRPGTLQELPGAWLALERENHELKEKAAREDQLHPSIIARLEEGVLLFGKALALERYNPAAQRLLGLGAPLGEGMAVQEVFPDSDSSQAIVLALQGKPSEWRMARAARTLRIRAIPFAPLGTISGVLLTLDDVTRQEALETTRQKFISNVSHELKTPVTAIRIAAENLQEEQLHESALLSAQSIMRSVDRLTLLLGDLSELSRIESGALTLQPESLQLRSFLASLERDFQARHGASGVHLQVEAEAPDGMPLVADPLRLSQVLENLISNAVKFSPPGGQVELRVTLSEQGHQWEVMDAGPGIPEAEQGRIFERFYRVPGSLDKPGTGLGLAIVKHLCRLMGGEVTVTSSPGQGAQFRVILPRMGDQAVPGPPSL